MGVNARLLDIFLRRGAAVALDELMTMLAGPNWRAESERAHAGSVAALERDAATFAGLKPNPRAEVRLSAGRHTVRVILDWTTSEAKEVTVPADGRVVLTAALPWSGVWRMITAPNSSLTLDEV